MMISRKYLIALTTVLVVVLTLTGCGKKPAPARPNIILITVDTLRADHLSCYGYTRQTSPFIDSIAREAVVFTQAYAVSSWTAPSMASIFTGHYPRRHGVMHGVARGSTAAITGQEMLVKDFLTLAEALKEAGYTTFGVSSNGHISKGTGFGQGFDYYATHWFMKSPATNMTVKKWAKPIGEASRYFLWVHYFDPHNPYAPRLPWYRTYITQGGHPGKWIGEVMANPKEYLEDLKKDPGALKVLIDRYDSEINYCDYYIREIFELLKPGPDTLVIITADHGEALLEHGQLLHGDTLFEEEIRVPLILKLPGKGKSTAGKTISLPVSNRDLFATILDMTGLEKTQKIPGDSLMPLITGETIASPAPIYFELDWNGWGLGVRSENRKLIISGRDKKEIFFYDLATDPRETLNLMEKDPGPAALLDSLLKRWVEENPEFKAPMIRIPVDKDQEDKLKTLGYL